MRQTWQVEEFVIKMVPKMMYLVGALAVAVVGVHMLWLMYEKKKKKIRHYLYDGETTVVRTVEEWEEICPRLLEQVNKIKVLGFDCEWETRYGRMQKVALLQLATSDSTCVLVQMCKLNSIPESLRQLLSDRKIFKVGVACTDDANKLHKDYGLTVSGCVDLRNLAIRSRSVRFGNYGLKSLAYKVLKVTMDKTHSVRCSNWEAEELSPEQIKYAAQDAVVAMEIFLQLVHNKMSSLTTRPSYSPEEFWQKAKTMCQGIVDCNFLSKRGQSQKLGDASSRPCRGNKARSTKSYSARTKPLYYNCQLQAPDGQMLCTCDLKKANWYLDQGLGVKVSDDPLVVQLNFEPAGRPLDEKNYYLQEKENICVVCGDTNSYIKKNIVPHEYRKYFPTVMKDHLSHDVVLLCLPCHQRSSIADGMMRKNLEALCDAPLANEKGVRKYHQDEALNKVRSAGKALMLNRQQIPDWRVQELETVVKDHFGVDELTLDLMEEATSIDPKRKNTVYLPHGKKVVEYMVENEGLQKFERQWREYFLETMKPQHMPKLWSVSHNHDRLKDLNNSISQT